MIMLSKLDILAALSAPDGQQLFDKADQIRSAYVGADVYIRGLLEISNHCIRNCLYCGLRRGNSRLERYRLSQDEILAVAKYAWMEGLRTLVIQSGDGVYTRAEVCGWITAIKERFPDLAITLSLGERPMDDYVAFRDAGADRYLLKHETINSDLYAQLHPGQSLSHRLRILEHLRGLGYQVGTGFIVGLPGQTIDDLVEEIIFLQDFQPDMVGLGPFMPQHDTPLGKQKAGGLDITLRCIALARCATRDALIPATTALISLSPANGLEAGLQAGANVVMVNATPAEWREQYAIYDSRARFTLNQIQERIGKIGRRPTGERGDSYKKRSVASMVNVAQL